MNNFNNKKSVTMIGVGYSSYCLWWACLFRCGRLIEVEDSEDEMEADSLGII